LEFSFFQTGKRNKAFRPGVLLTFLILAAALSLVFPSCSTTGHYIVPTTSEPMGAAELAGASRESLEMPPLPEEPGPYLVGPGDILLVRDLNHPDLFSGSLAPTPEAGRFNVSDDGGLSLPMVGEVEAEGKTLTELREDVQAAFLHYVRNPNISLTVSEYRSQRVYVLGQVGAPGAYPYDGRITVLDALGAAQGLTEKSDLTGSYLVRGGEVLPVDFYGLLRKGEMSGNIKLAGGDLLYIADTSDRKVYVLGEVKNPGVFPMGSEPLRLIDAISMAGGLDLVTAKKGEIYLVRGGYADPDVYRLNLSDVMSLTGTETFLEPGDRIYAAATGLTNWNRFMVQLLPFLQGGESASQIKVDME